MLLVLRTRWRNRVAGSLFFVWAGWYGLQRFLIDSVRYGSGDATVGPFTWNQVSGLVAAMAAVVILVWLRAPPARQSRPDDIQSRSPDAE